MPSCNNTNIMSVLYFLIVTNMISHIDQGIIFGASNEIDSFIKQVMHLTSQNESIYLGLLQSSFIAGYALSAPIFAHFVHYYQPFRLIAFGLCIWMFAVVISGGSSTFDSVYMLFIGRVFSGVGQSAFQCIGLPWIIDNAPANRKNLWLSLFFVATPAGFVLGYTYAARIGLIFGWQWVFYLECIGILPLIFFCLTVSPDIGYLRDMGILDTDLSSNHQSKNELPNVSSGEILDGSGVEMNTSHIPSTCQEFCAVMNKPIFLFIVLGYAAYTATFVAFLTFGPNYVLSLQFFSDKTKVSIMFGAIASASEFLGTIIGGILADRLINTELMNNIGAEESEMLEDFQKSKALKIMTFSVLIAAGLLLIGVMMRNRIIFLTFLFFGGFVMFIPTSSIMRAIMLSVPRKNRPYALALNTFGKLAFGDILSPIVVALLIKTLAPDCTIVVINDTPTLNPNCIKHHQGFTLVVCITVLWLSCSISSWFIAWMMMTRAVTTAPIKPLNVPNSRTSYNIYEARSSSSYSMFSPPSSFYRSPKKSEEAPNMYWSKVG